MNFRSDWSGIWCTAWSLNYTLWSRLKFLIPWIQISGHRSQRRVWNKKSILSWTAKQMSFDFFLIVAHWSIPFLELLVVLIWLAIVTRLNQRNTITLYSYPMYQHSVTRTNLSWLTILKLSAIYYLQPLLVSRIFNCKDSSPTINYLIMGRGRASKVQTIAWDDRQTTTERVSLQWCFLL